MLYKALLCCSLSSITAASLAAEASVEVVQISVSRVAKTSQQTPIALSALVPESSVEHPADWLNQLAGVWLTQTSGQEQLTAIRSPVLTGPGSCSAFYFAQDEIPLRANGFCNVNQLFDAHTEVAELIEITKGPASALMGSSALFGSVNVRLPDELSQNSASISLKGSEYQQANLALNVPIAEQDLLALVSLHRDEGYRESSGFDQQKLTLRHQTQWGGWLSTSSFSLNRLDQQTASFIEGEKAYEDKSLRRVNPTPNAYRKASSWRAHTRLSRVSADSQLTITPYIRSNQMEFLMHFVPWQPIEKNEHASLGAQVRYQSRLWDTLTLYSGADLEWTQGSLSEYQPEPSPFSPQKFPQGWHYDYEVDARSTGADLGVLWQLHPKLSLDASARLDHDYFDYNNLLSDGPACPEQPENCRFYRPASDAAEFTEPSARMALSYFHSKENHWYLQLNRAFRSPHTSEMYRLQQGQQQADLNPVALKAIELGQKYRQSNLQLSWALYAMWRDEVIFQNSERHYVGGAKTKHQGLEYELLWQASERWQLSWNGSYAKHTYGNSPDLLSSSAVIKGNEVDTAPRQLNTARLSWQTTTDIELSLMWQQQGRYYLDPENRESYPGHQLWQFSSRWQLEEWQLQAHISNLADKAYATRADLSFGEERYLPGEGRRIQITLSHRW